jgi:3-dehydroquinate synthase
MVDSSVGGKTAIDNQYGKNLIGAFWQPKLVIMDLNVLRSLSKIHLVSGIIEAVKIFLTLDIKNFIRTQNNLIKILTLNYKALELLIYNAVKLKGYVVNKDPHDTHYRSILNFGHTIGHAIEQASNYNIPHAYAVAYGILVETQIAVNKGILSADAYAVISTFFKQIAINIEQLYYFDVEQIIVAATIDKKNKNNKIYAIILKELGAVYTVNNSITHEITPNEIRQVFAIK